MLRGTLHSLSIVDLAEAILVANDAVSSCPNKDAEGFRLWLKALDSWEKRGV